MKRLLILVGLLIATPVFAYSVRPGDTLSLLARRFNTTVLELAVKNGIKNPNLILVGQELQTNERIIGATPSEPTSSQSYNPVTGYQTRTTQYVSALATTIPVVSTKDISGKQIVLANISPSTTVKVYLNFEPGTTKEEPFMCTGLTATSWTGCTRGLPFQSGSEITSTTIAQTHNAGAAVVITNIGQFYNQFVSIDGAQTIYGVKTFNALPVSSATPTANNQFITLGFLTTVSTTGCADASTAVRGCVQEATTSSLQSGTNVGSTGARLFLSPSSTATSSAISKIVVTTVTGTIDASFGGTTSSLATLDTNRLVVQNPANATSTPTANKIPIANVSGTLHMNWIATSTTNTHQFLRSTSTGAYWGDIGVSQQSTTTLVRGLDVTYQNTSTFPIFVNISVYLDTTKTLDVFVSSTPAVGIIVSRIASQASQAQFLSTSFIVPAGWFYKTVSGGSGTLQLYNWYEMQL